MPAMEKSGGIMTTSALAAQSGFGLILGKRV
jgi:hypothetical protein